MNGFHVAGVSVELCLVVATQLIMLLDVAGSRRLDFDLQPLIVLAMCLLPSLQLTFKRCLLLLDDAVLGNEVGLLLINLGLKAVAPRRAYSKPSEQLCFPLLVA
jgi:hypothetical protein